MKFWEFWREWGRNVWANKYGKRVITYLIIAIVFIVMVVLEEGCDVNF